GCRCGALFKRTRLHEFDPPPRWSVSPRPLNPLIDPGHGNEKGIMNMKFSLRFPYWPALLASAGLLCLGVVPGRADVLLGPGGTTLTPGETFPGAGSLVAIQTVASPNGNPNFSSRLNEAVFREKSCTLDFLFQL